MIMAREPQKNRVESIHRKIDIECTAVNDRFFFFQPQAVQQLPVTIAERAVRLDVAE